MTFLNENLAYKKFEFKSCMKIKGSKFEEDLKTLLHLDVTIESDEVDPEAPPTTMINYALTLVGLTIDINEAIFEVKRSYLDPESPKYEEVFLSNAIPEKLSKEQQELIKKLNFPSVTLSIHSDQLYLSGPRHLISLADKELATLLDPPDHFATLDFPNLAGLVEDSIRQEIKQS
jgi:hypothetical protein